MKKLWPGKFGKAQDFNLEKIPFKNIAFVAFLACLLSILLVFAIRGFLPPQVPLFYGLAEGEEQLVPSYGLVIPASLALAIIVLNIALANVLKDDFLKKTLVLTGTISAFLAVVTIVKIVFLVGSF